MTDEPISVVGRISEQDYVRAQWLAMRPGPVRTIFWTLMLGLLLVAAGVRIVGFLDGTYSAAEAFPVPLMVCVVVVVVFVLVPWRIRRSYRNFPAIREPIDTRWTAEGLDYDSERAKGEVPWRMFVKYRENRHVFLVYQSPRLFHMVPKSMLRPGDEERLRDLLRRNLGKAR